MAKEDEAELERPTERPNKNWISIWDDQPAINDRVLACDAGDTVEFATYLGSHFEVDARWEKPNGIIKRQVHRFRARPSYLDEEVDDLEFEFWMPLPAAPES